MKRFRQVWVWLVAIVLCGLVVAAAVHHRLGAAGAPAPPRSGPHAQRAHLDHSAFFNDKLATGPDVTRACMRCHQQAALDLLGTAHFQWQDQEVTDHRTGDRIRIGKKNLLNNFCISIHGNLASCTKCHAGYGWARRELRLLRSRERRLPGLPRPQRRLRQGRGGRAGRKGVDLLAAARVGGLSEARELRGLPRLWRRRPGREARRPGQQSGEPLRG